MDALVRAIGAMLSRGDEIVLGYPLNMDGTRGSRAALVEAFAERLRARTGRRVHLWDERLTSAEADWSLAGSGLTRGQKKKRRDQIAAARILEDFLRAQGGAADDPGNP